MQQRDTGRRSCFSEGIYSDIDALKPERGGS